MSPYITRVPLLAGIKCFIDLGFRHVGQYNRKENISSLPKNGCNCAGRKSRETNGDDTRQLGGQCIYIAVKLGIADHLKEGPKGSGELSHIVGANHTALYQLLRALAGLGVFHEEPDKHFSLTAMEDFERLLKLSGFSMRSISRMESGFSIIEAVPVC